MALDTQALGRLAASFLERQPWFTRAIAGQPASRLETTRVTVLAESPPGLASVVLDHGALEFQVLVGWRPPEQVAEVLAGSESALMGPYPGDGQLLAYDALADDELALALLGIASGGAETAERVRQVSSLVSHASLVYDERFFMKVYRVLERGTRPEVEVMLGLDDVGFNAMLAPVAVWAAEGFDLALVREFQAGALEGRMLALTSLRDLLARASVEHDKERPLAATSVEGLAEAAVPPLGEEAVGSMGAAESASATDVAAATAGGDLAAEMHRLGAMSGSMHAALATAFGDEPADPQRFAAVVAPGSPEGSRQQARERSEELAVAIGALDPDGAGRSIRLHGDYHLRRVMRSEAGWLVAGFGDDPLYRPAPSVGAGRAISAWYGSPAEDLADMCFSLQRVAEEALSLRAPAEGPTAAALAASWIKRNTTAFLDGYLTVPAAEGLVPQDPEVLQLLLEGFVLVRARRYEATVAPA